MVKFNVRGGPKLRKAYNKAKAKKTAKYECPSCGKKAVHRLSAGLWECKSCGTKVAGGAYELVTPTGKLAKRLIRDLAGQRNVKLEEIESEIAKVEEE